MTDQNSAPLDHEVAEPVESAVLDGLDAHPDDAAVVADSEGHEAVDVSQEASREGDAPVWPESDSRTAAELEADALPDEEAVVAGDGDDPLDGLDAEPDDAAEAERVASYDDRVEHDLGGTGGTYSEGALPDEGAPRRAVEDSGEDTVDDEDLVVAEPRRSVVEEDPASDSPAVDRPDFVAPNADGVVEAVEEEAREDLREVARMSTGKKLGLACLAAASVAGLLLGVKVTGVDALTQGTKVQVAGYVFGAPKGWDVTATPQGKEQKGIETVRLDGPGRKDDTVRVSVMDTAGLGVEKGQAAARMCSNIESSFRSSMMEKGSEVTVGSSPVDGLQGCTVRAVGRPSATIEGIGEPGSIPAKVVIQVGVVQKADSSQLFSVFGAHSEESKLAGGQVESAIIKQVSKSLKK